MIDNSPPPSLTTYAIFYISIFALNSIFIEKGVKLRNHKSIDKVLSIS